MERSASDANMRTIPPKPVKLLSKISTADAGFLRWYKEQLEQKPGMEMREARKRYMGGISIGRMEIFNKQIGEHPTYLDSLPSPLPYPCPLPVAPSPRCSHTLLTLSSSSF
jgi:hypothetical protein